MKRNALTAVLAVIVVVGAGWGAVSQIMNGIDRSKSRRLVGDAIAIAVAIDGYRATHGAYPACLDASGLQAALVPGQMRSLPDHGVRYFSDGSTYTLFVRNGHDGPYPMWSWGVLEIRDGKWVSWPEWFEKKDLEFSKRLRSGVAGAQPNNALDLPVRPVTPVENRATDAPGRSAGQRERYPARASAR